MPVIGSERSSWLAPADAARLHMSVPNNPMVIGIVLRFAGHFEHDALVALLRGRLGALPQFRQQVVTPFGLGPSYWETSPQLDFDAHVELRTLKAGAAPEALEEAVSDVMSMPLSLARPPWDLNHIARRPSEGASSPVSAI